MDGKKKLNSSSFEVVWNLARAFMADEAGEIDLLYQATHFLIYAEVQSDLWELAAKAKARDAEAKEATKQRLLQGLHARAVLLWTEWMLVAWASGAG